MEKSLRDKKAQMREQYRKIRSSISAPDRRLWDTAIVQRILALPEVRTANVVFVYLSCSGEVSTQPLVDQLLAQGKRVLTPSPDIKSLPHDGLFKFVGGSGIQADFKPTACLESRIEDIDVVLVPGIVWDKDGYRVGFGGGYFDRLLSMLRPDCLKIGLAFECQMAGQVPREQWDEQTDLVVTERHLYGISAKWLIWNDLRSSLLISF